MQDPRMAPGSGSGVWRYTHTPDAAANSTPSGGGTALGLRCWRIIRLHPALIASDDEDASGLVMPRGPVVVTSSSRGTTKDNQAPSPTFTLEHSPTPGRAYDALNPRLRSAPRLRQTRLKRVFTAEFHALKSFMNWSV
jgi:hypothetical protein